MDVQILMAGARTLGVIANERLMIVAEKRDDAWGPVHAYLLGTGRTIDLEHPDFGPVVHGLVRDAVDILDQALAVRVMVAETAARMRGR